MVTLDYSNVLPFIGGQEAVDRMEPQIKVAHDMLHKKNGPGNDFLGWLDLPTNYDKEEFSRIKKAAAKIRRDSDVLIVIGIGGSYLGARAVIEMLGHSFANVASKKVRKSPIILFCGNSISATYLADMMDIIEGKNISLNIISKSGTTTEPAIAFRILRAYMENKYGKEEAKNRIYATTDKARGALKGLADEEGYETFVVPDDVGGRFSVLTAVGLLPIAVAGIDIKELQDEQGEYTHEKAALHYNKHILDEKADNLLELRYTDRKRIHNLKYYTWVEQQGKTSDELNALWYDEANTWGALRKEREKVDELINEFNEATGLLKKL